MNTMTMKTRLLVILSIIIVSQTEESSPGAITNLIGESSLDTGSLATLVYVAVVSRHGSRSPTATYPNDPYPLTNKLFWPNGAKELTNFGKQQLFMTGQSLKKRYPGFLPHQYFPNDTVVKYNDVPRDFMSGASILAALYPPVGSQVWNPDLLWQPIPLSLKNYDVCVLPYFSFCSSFKTVSDKLMKKLEEEGRKNATVTNILKEVSLHAGSNISSISKLEEIYDTLLMDVENGFKLPAWAKKYFPEPLRSLTAPVLLTQYAGSDYLVEMSAGPELKYISDLLNMKANGTFEKSRKMYIELCHDCTLLVVLKAFGNNDPYLEIATSAYITFELHYLPDIYIVQVLYHTDSFDKDPKYIDIAGCPSPCSLENFTKFVDSLNPTNWEQQCKKTVLQ